MRHRTAEMVILCLMLLLTTALRFGGLARESVWIDEVFTVVRAEENGWGYLAREPASLLAYFGVLVGRIDYALRFPFAAAGILGVAVIYQVGRRLFGRTEGIISTFLLATAIYHIRWSQQIRYYSLVVLFSLLAIYFLNRAIRANRLADWGGFVIASTLNIQNHPSGFFVLGSLGVWAGLLLVWDEVKGLRTSENPGTGSEGRVPSSLQSWLSRRVVRLTLSVVAIAALVLPAVVKAMGTVSLSGDPVRESYRTYTFEVSTAYFWAVLRGLTWDYCREGVIAGSMLALFSLGLGLSIYRRQWRQALLATSWVFVPILAIQLLVTRSIVNFGAVRHFMFWLPMLLLFVSRGVVGLGRVIDSVLGLLKPIADLPRGLGTNLVLLAVFLMSLRLYPMMYTQPQQTQWQEAAELIDEEHQPGDVVLINAGFNVQPFDWYAQSSEEDLRRLPFPEETRFM
ncbi:MAG: glycosyltransferase family 39 protein, partial [Anaerolineae bacterium]